MQSSSERSIAKVTTEGRLFGFNAGDWLLILGAAVSIAILVMLV